MSDELEKTHALLRGAIEVWTRSYLWVPGDTPNFKPALCDKIFGDGRALFMLTTINLRPCYYVIRCDSQWASGSDTNSPWPEIPENDFCEHVDEIVETLERQFGRGRCGYSGSSLYVPSAERGCDCEECADEYVAEWPVLDDYGGCSWGRMRWPFGFPVIDHPWCRFANLLREDFRP
jgi:hypothetical protein